MVLSYGFVLSLRLIVLAYHFDLSLCLTDLPYCFDLLALPYHFAFCFAFWTPVNGGSYEITIVCLSVCSEFFSESVH